MTAAPGSDRVSDDTQKTRVEVWLTDPAKWATEAEDVGLSAAAEFNRAHPEYEIVVKGLDFRRMPVEVARAVEQGDVPDVVEFHGDATRTALDTIGRDGEPLFTSIDRAIAGRTEILGEPVVLGDMIPALREFFRYEGELMSLTRTASSVVLFTNMDLLAKAGVTEPPRTWREVTAACEALAKVPGGPSHGVTWPNFYWPFIQAVTQQGGLMADHDNGRSGRAETVDLATSEMMAFAGWWQRLHQDGHFLYSGKVWDFPGTFTAFENQEVAMMLSSSVDTSHLLQRGERQGFAVAVSAMPHNDEAPYAGNVMGGFSLWLTAGLSQEKQDGALAFMQYLNNPRHAAEWAREHYRIPLTRSALAVLGQEGVLDRDPYRRVPGDQLEASDCSPASFGPLVGGNAEIMNELTGAMHDVLTGGVDPQARFREAGARAQQILEAYNAYCAGPPRRTPDRLEVTV